MRLLIGLLPALLLGAAPQPAVTKTMGVFQTWGIHPASPVAIVAGGLMVEVAATPANCQLKTRDAISTRLAIKQP